MLGVFQRHGGGREGRGLAAATPHPGLTICQWCKLKLLLCSFLLTWGWVAEDQGAESGFLCPLAPQGQDAESATEREFSLDFSAFPLLCSFFTVSVFVPFYLKGSMINPLNKGF